jgi:hypothetical protein
MLVWRYIEVFWKVDGSQMISSWTKSKFYVVEPDGARRFEFIIGRLHMSGARRPCQPDQVAAALGLGRTARLAEAHVQWGWFKASDHGGVRDN